MDPQGESDSGQGPKSFWKTLPGIFAQIAAVIVAITGLVTALNAIGLIGGDDTEVSPTTSTAPPTIGPAQPTTSQQGTPQDDEVPGELELVAASVGGSTEAPTIEIQVRNTAPEVAFISEVRVLIERYDPFVLSGQVASSATYDIEFPAGRDLDLPVTISTAVSQSVDPSGPTAVDRFTIAVGVPEGGPSAIHSYDVRVFVVYNAEQLIAGPSEQFNVRITSR